MSERRVEDCPIKFGPIWLRNFSREGSAGAAGGSSNVATGGTGRGRGAVPRNQPQPTGARPTQQGPKHKLAQFRYGREEMLALYEDDADPPAGLSSFDLYVPQAQRPLALSTDPNEEDMRDLRNPMGLNRNKVAGAGPGLQPMDRYGMGRSMSEAARGRPRVHQSYNLSSNGRGILHRDDNQYGDAPAPGLSRSWSSGPHSAPRSDHQEWNPNRSYNKNRWAEPNWRRPTSTGRSYGEDMEPTSGLKRLQPLARPRQSLEKRDMKLERPMSWTANRRPWNGEPQFSDERLPEWALEGGNETGGTFDSSGAFHGVDSSVRSWEPQYGLARSHTQGSINIRSRSHEDDHSEQNLTWWNSKKSADAEAKKFDATKIAFKKETDKSEQEQDLLTLPAQDQMPSATGEEEDKKKKHVTFDTEDNYHNKMNKTMKQLYMQQQQTGEEGSGNFTSVLLTSNNSLRQKHQNMIQPEASMAEMVKEIIPEKTEMLEDVSRLGPNPLGSPGETAGYASYTSRLPSTPIESTAPSQAVFPRLQTEQPMAINMKNGVNNALLKNFAQKLVKGTNSWYYEDPQKNVQGPFTSYEMYQWYKLGFFSANLMIRRESDQQMRPLGSYGQIPPFAESYSDFLAAMSRDPSLRHYDPEATPNIIPSTEHILGASNVLPDHMNRTGFIQDRLIQPQIPPAMQMLSMPANNLQGQIQPAQIHSEPMPQAMQQPALPQSLPSKMQHAQMQNLQQSQPMLHNPMNRNIPFPRDVAMNSTFAGAQLQPDIPTQSNYRSGYGMDILAPSIPTTSPPVMPFANRTVNNFHPLLGQQQPMVPVETMWGQSVPNFSWMQTPRPANAPDNHWNVRAGFQPRNTMQEQKSKSSTPDLELQSEMLRMMLSQASLNEETTQSISQMGVKTTDEKANDSVVTALKQNLPADELIDKRNTGMTMERKETEPTETQPVKDEELVAVIEPKEEPIPVQPAPQQTPTKTAKTGQTPPVDKSNKAKDSGKKSKTKANEGDKKKKDAKQEIKIEEVPGYVKVKKDDRKKDAEKKKELRACMEKIVKTTELGVFDNRKNEENKIFNDTSRKGKQEDGQTLDVDADGYFNKYEHLFLDSDGNTAQSLGSASKKAPWYPSMATPAANNDGLTLAEIQRLEREKKFESIKEQQHMIQLIAQQQQAAMAREQEITQSGYNWTKVKSPEKTDQHKSLAEIQEQTRRNQKLAALESQNKMATPATPPLVSNPTPSTPWTPTATGPAASFAGGFWEATPNKADKKSPTHVSRPAEPSSKTKKTKQPASPAKPTPEKEFDDWCSTVLAAHAAQIDVPVFVSFLKDIESPYEVRDYVKCYLGETKESTDFARNFLEKRLKLNRGATASYVDDLCSPAPAKNPLSSSEFQEVKGRPKKVNKKFKYVDSRILGFSVTASEDRINVGDIDSV